MQNRRARAKGGAALSHSFTVWKGTYDPAAARFIVPVQVAGRMLGIAVCDFVQTQVESKLRQRDE